MSRREIWEQIYWRFDVCDHVTLAGWRADRTLSPARKIIESLSAPGASDTRIIVNGAVGTGKTTELLRVAEARASHELVVFLDVARHFDRLGRLEGLQHVSAWEVYMLVGLVLHRIAEEELGLAFPECVLSDLESAWLELACASGTRPPAQLDQPKLEALLLTAGIASSGDPARTRLGAGPRGVTDAWHASWNLPMGASSIRIPGDDERVQTMLHTVNRVIAEVQTRHRPVLLLTGGLDRLRAIERARELFIESDVLARLVCRVVICGPFALGHHPRASIVPRFQLQPLVNEPVLDRHDPTRPGPGLSFFSELFLRRAEDLGGAALIPQPLIDHLAFYSGGRARDFVQMIRQVAEAAWQADVEVATWEIVNSVVDQERRSLETGLHRGHIDVLEAVMRDPDHRLPKDDLVWELLTLSRLLPYPDHSGWCYPHPLLTLRLLGRAGSARRAS